VVVEVIVSLLAHPGALMADVRTVQYRNTRPPAH
jgi:hypothetical protein